MILEVSEKSEEMKIQQFILSKIGHTVFTSACFVQCGMLRNRKRDSNDGNKFQIIDFI